MVDAEEKGEGRGLTSSIQEDSLGEDDLVSEEGQSDLNGPRTTIDEVTCEERKKRDQHEKGSVASSSCGGGLTVEQKSMVLRRRSSEGEEVEKIVELT